MKNRRKKKGLTITHIRRTTQLLMLLTIIAVPFFSQNPSDWSPSSIVMGHLPPPTIFPISGDTWCLSINGFFICHPIAFIESVSSYRRVIMPFFIAALLPLGITILFGRVFCSWLCPMGFLLELLMKIPDRWRGAVWKKALEIKDFRFIALGGLLAVGFFGKMALISVFDPPHALGRELINLFSHHRLSIAGAGLLTLVLLLDLFALRRGWCRYFCPSGGGLSLLGRGRIVRIGLENEKCIQCRECAKICPVGLDPSLLKSNPSEFNWALCDNCGLCVDRCPRQAINYHVLHGVKNFYAN